MAGMGVAVTGSPTVKSTVMMSPNITTSAAYHFVDQDDDQPRVGLDLSSGASAEAGTNHDFLPSVVICRPAAASCTMS